MTEVDKDPNNTFIEEIEPLINGLVNPVAAYWVQESSLFKQLNNSIDSDHIAASSPASISNHAVARYLYLQLELTESVFMPINDTIVQCIKVSSINTDNTLLHSMMKFFTSASIEYLTTTFTIEKARYWLGVMVKLKNKLLEPSSPYYQLITAADLEEIRQLVAPWRNIIDRIRSQYNCNYPVLTLLLLMTQVSCISGWKTARSVFELTSASITSLRQQSATDPLYNYSTVLQYFGQLKGALVTHADQPLVHCFSFAASSSTVYKTTRALLGELSAEDCAAILHYLRGEYSLGAQMMHHELLIVRCIDKWLYEE